MAALVALGAPACNSPAKTAIAAPPPPPLHLGPITDYVPAAGLRWMLVGSPRRIAEHVAFRDAIVLLLPPARLDGFTLGAGVDLRKVDSALIAGFDLGTLYAVAPDAPTIAHVVARFRERIVSGERRHLPHPNVERIAGVIGTTPETLVRVDQHLVAIAVGDPTPARVVEAFARGKLRTSPTALHGAALSTLSPAPAGSVATFYAPGPFSGEWARAARGLFADALALSISVLPISKGRARFVVEVAGDFPAAGSDELTGALADLAASPMGKLLGLDQSDTPPVVHEKAHALSLDVDLDLGPVAHGLHAAVAADVWEIMDMPAPK